MPVLPVIDFTDFASRSAQARQEIAMEIHQAIIETGFFYLDGHGLETSIADCMAAAQWFFDCPQADKREMAIEKSSCHRGWYTIGGETLDARHHPEGDYKEGLKIGQDLDPSHPFVQMGLPLHGPNLWLKEDPENQACKARKFNNSMRDTYQHFSQLSTTLMQAFALGLGLAENYFDRYFLTPMATLSPLYYPSLKPHKGRISAGAHTDFGCLSLLAQDQTNGLEIQTKDGQWLAIPYRENALVVNIGDMLSFWTGGVYPSTIHRVVNTSDRPRRSVVFFFDPQHDTPLDIITPNAQLDGRVSENSLTALQHLLNKISNSFRYKDFND